MKVELALSLISSASDYVSPREKFSITIHNVKKVEILDNNLTIYRTNKFVEGQDIVEHYGINDTLDLKGQPFYLMITGFKIDHGY